ncbi:hypothetical protein CPB84DRAFT_1844934 [Gymnopilus junonius]|uniref:NUC153 domain-containing protein n=1 Tax=Gymnopilus junonius TaxID=109634 RepID=A0A9P5NVP9_GYMJU|nr:hypothetical protein CPB84DRAFT_1844934 [Gymnopilus junonius]
MSDPRFSRLKSDPRFRRPKKKRQKVVIDERFKSVFANDKKKNGKCISGRKVDKYGRAISSAQEQENLQRYYRLEGDAEEDEETPRKPDLARGEVLLESSDEEQEEDSDSDGGGFITLGADSSRPIAVDDENAEIDLDEDNYADLDAQAASYSKAHQDADEQANIQHTSRLAIVNLDWDHVRADHLYKICSSLVSPTAPAVLTSNASLPRTESSRRYLGKGEGQVTVMRGKVLSVRVYPSDFGKKRMEREEKEGPPPEIFRKRKDLDVDEVNETTVYEVGGEEEYDEDALRKYQLERLRHVPHSSLYAYYYAIVTCDTVDAAFHIYNELEGTELERSANVFDMSFVPEDMMFENEPRDETTEEDVNGNYRAIEFVTDALRHSKVKLTWDDDDPERLNVTRRNLSQKEIEESDFKAYLANSSSESEEEEESVSRKKSDKKASREKLRALLLGGNQEAMPEGWGDDDNAEDVDMEITFTPGLSDKKSPEDETTLERYQRKMKEKKKKRKEEVKEVVKEKKQEDEFFEPDSEGETERADKGKSQKDRTQKSRNAEPDQESPSRTKATAEELALLVTSDNHTAEPKHFNLKSVIKAEKQKKRKKGKKGKAEDDNEAQEDFVMDVKDERFKALFENHQFAIDPTNPQFKKTKAMTTLLEERQKRIREQRGSRDGVVSKIAKSITGNSANGLQSLVESVKRKSANIDTPGQGKRRKL